MKRPIVNLLCVLFVFCLSSLNAQIIIKVISGYVLIDKDTGIGKLNEEIKVYRLKGDGVVTVGQVRILRFQDGKTGAQVVREEPGFKIGVGDFVVEKRSDEVTAPRVVPKRTILDKPSGRIPRKRKKSGSVGVHLGILIPASNLEDTFENSYSLGVTLKLITVGNHSIFVDAAYPILKMMPNGTVDTKSSLYLVHLVDHIRMRNRIHWDVGGGIYYLSWSVAGQDAKESELYTGFFIGFSVDFTGSSGITFSPTIRYHAYKVETDWFEFIVGGMNVYFSVF